MTKQWRYEYFWTCFLLEKVTHLHYNVSESSPQFGGIRGPLIILWKTNGCKCWKEKATSTSRKQHKRQCRTKAKNWHQNSLRAKGLRLGNKGTERTRTLAKFDITRQKCTTNDRQTQRGERTIGGHGKKCIILAKQKQRKVTHRYYTVITTTGDVINSTADSNKLFIDC